MHYKCPHMSHGYMHTQTHAHILNNHRNLCCAGNMMCLCYVIINWAQLGFLHLQQNITHYLSKSVYSQFVLKILTIVKVQDGKPVGIKEVKLSRY